MAPPPTKPHAPPPGWALVHIITRLELGGAQRVCMRQVSGVQFGTGAKYLAYGPGGLLDAEAQALPGVQPLEVFGLDRAINPRRDAQALLTLVRQLRAVRRAHPTRRLLVHTHSSKAGILGRLAAKAAGAHCVVHTVHGFGHQPHMGAGALAAGALAERLVGRVTDGQVWVAEANLQRAQKEGLLAAKTQHRLVRAGVDTAAFAPPTTPVALQALQAATAELNQECNLAADAPVVLSVACLKPQKDPLTLVRVAAKVCAVRPDVVFVLAGDGVLRGPVESLVRALNLQHNFRLLGWRSDVATWMHRARLLLHTSLWEGLPQVFVQAMAAGLPVVATDVDGAAEAVLHGQTGLLCAPKDVDALARGTYAVLEDPCVAKQMGIDGQRHAEAFDEARMFNALGDFYAQLCVR